MEHTSATRLGRLLGVAALAVGIAGCMGTGTVGEELAVDCGGKCDGLSSVRSLIADPLDLDVSDLVAQGAPFTSEAVDAALSSSDYASIDMAPTETFGRDDLEALVTGLAARYGETELSTLVNRIRRDHLVTSGDDRYAEAAFELTSNLGGSFSVDAGGLGGSVKLGFAGASIQTRVVSAFDGSIESHLQSPLQAIREARGFVLPRGVEDIREMKPGELVAMRAGGFAGINLGVGVPMLIGDGVAYKLVFSAGARALLEGELDIQLVKLEGGEVVIDVGIEQARVRSVEVAVRDGWGVQGLVEREVELGGRSVDLGRMVDKAVRKQLEKRLSFIEGRFEKTQTRFRLSVARLRFDIDSASPELLEAAIAQAMRGDVRLAQAMANRDEPGFGVDFDFLRSGVSAASSAGLDIFGMKFFRNEIANEGSIVVNTPGGARTILFDSLHQESGVFLSRHGFTRVGLSGLTHTPDGQTIDGEANLFVQLSEGDKAMERDKFVDQMDSLIVSLAGNDALRAMEGVGNDIEDLVESTCAGTRVFDDCPIDMATSQQVQVKIAEGIARVESASSHLSPEVRALLSDVARLRMTSQSVYEQKAGFTGPGVDLVVDYRLGEPALTALMSEGAEGRFRSALSPVVQAVELDRLAGDLEAQRNEIAADYAAEIDTMVDLVARHSGRYRAVLESERASIETLGAIGTRTVELAYEVRDGRPDYESAHVRSLVHRRAQIATTLFDELFDAAEDLDMLPEFAVGYALLGAVGADHADVRVSLKQNLDDTAAFWREPYRAAGLPERYDTTARGAQAGVMKASGFDVDALVEID